MSTKTELMNLTQPTVTDDVEQTISDLAANFGIIDKLFPVGSIVQSTVNTDPSTYIGGTWTQITDKFLVAAGATFTAGSTGGASTMGVHKSGEEAPEYGLTLAEGFRGRVIVAGSDYTGKILPPYKAVYTWERTA